MILEYDLEDLFQTSIEACANFSPLTVEIVQTIAEKTCIWPEESHTQTLCSAVDAKTYPCLVKCSVTS